MKKFLFALGLYLIPLVGLMANRSNPPQLSIVTDGNVTSVHFDNINVQTTSLVYTQALNNPTAYSINWNSSANALGLVNQSTTSFAFSANGGSITGITIPAGTPSGFYEGVLTITNGVLNYTYNIRLMIFDDLPIGEVTWADKNLDVVTYRNGDTIPQVSDPTVWANLTSGAWCYYDNDPTNNLKFGKLYNWYAIHDSRGLAPVGYHIPLASEWLNLQATTTAIDGDIRGLTATSLWSFANGTNARLFNNFPSGTRAPNGSFYGNQVKAEFWDRATDKQLENQSFEFVRLYTTNMLFQYSNSPTSGNAVRLVKEPNPITCTGSVSENWSDPSNWDLGRLPQSFDHVVLNSGSKTKLDVDFMVENKLEVHNPLVVNPNIQLSFPVTGETNFNTIPVTFLSDATGSGVLGEVYGNLINIRNWEFQRYFSARRAYRLFSPAASSDWNIRSNYMEGADLQTTTGYPYTVGSNFNFLSGYGTQITGLGGNANGFDETVTNNPSLFKFNYKVQNWEAITNTSGKPIAGNPYRIMIRGDRGTDLNNNNAVPSATVLTTYGKPFIGKIDSSMNVNAGDWILIGNPYQSIINGFTLAQMAQNITPFYYVWDPTVGTRGAYVTFDFNVWTNNYPGSEVNDCIQPGQAVFVQADLDGSTRLIIDEWMKIQPQFVFGSTVTNVFKPVVAYPMLNVSLNYSDSLAQNAPAMDGLRLILDNSFSNNIDRNDARKLTNLDETMAINEGGTLLSIEKRDIISMNTEIPLSITQFKRQQYTLRINWSNPVDNGMQASIKDNYTNTTTPISFSANTDYTFTVDNSIAASKAADRFTLVFVPNAALPVSGLTLSGTTTDKQVKLTFKALNEHEMSGYDVERSSDGISFTTIGNQQPLNGNLVSVNYSFVDNQPIIGSNYYRIKGSSVNGQVQYSNISAIKFSINNAGVNVVPNPVEANRLQLQVNHLQKGSYNVTVSDVIGRVITTREILFDGTSNVISLSLPSTVHNGSYYVKVEGQGNTFTQSFLVK